MDLSPIRGESTGSFISRLAEANALPAAHVLELLGKRTPGVADWRLSEVLLSEAATVRLALLAGRDVEHLRRALPTLASRAGARAVRVAAWPAGWTVIAECGVCVRSRGDGLQPAWLASGDTWQVCTRHGRWLSTTDPAEQRSLTPVPDVVVAHRRWLRLKDRLGPYARALLADAAQVSSYWWQCRQMGSATVWACRQRELGLGRELTWAFLVTYPEAVRLAEAMAVYERQRRWGREFDDGAPDWVSRHWIDWAGDRLGMTEGMERGGYRALRAWTIEHSIATPVAVRRRQTPPPPGYLRERLPLMEPHRGLVERGPLEDVSCLPWKRGGSVTTV
ncbi:TniQ family protein [Streptomyces sp. NPDC002992]|uniref:TniQ family protein n=1 Tax=Streptomyces sp. NPDC002992 TaxID=3154273 RepID=UPI0033B0E424